MESIHNKLAVAVVEQAQGGLIVGAAKSLIVAIDERYCQVIGVKVPLQRGVEKRVWDIVIWCGGVEVALSALSIGIEEQVEELATATKGCIDKTTKRGVPNLAIAVGNPIVEVPHALFDVGDKGCKVARSGGVCCN